MRFSNVILPCDLAVLIFICFCIIVPDVTFFPHALGGHPKNTKQGFNNYQNRHVLDVGFDPFMISAALKTNQSLINWDAVIVPDHRWLFMQTHTHFLSLL